MNWQDTSALQVFDSPLNAAPAGTGSFGKALKPNAGEASVVVEAIENAGDNADFDAAAVRVTGDSIKEAILVEQTYGGQDGLQGELSPSSLGADNGLCPPAGNAGTRERERVEPFPALISGTAGNGNGSVLRHSQTLFGNVWERGNVSFSSRHVGLGAGRDLLKIDPAGILRDQIL